MAPEFPDGLDWLNTDRPLRLADLRGKIVLLDFWTYCCINCMHVLPDLERLEREFADELVVIGVHSAKFTRERVTENIRDAILRHGISHPVVNDRDMLVWRKWGVHAWPTAVLIGPEGRVVDARSGEGVYAHFAPLIREIASSGRADLRPVRIALERDKQPPRTLDFPGKVLATKSSGVVRLFVTDSGHNRLLVMSEDGSLVDQIGSGRAGMTDGTFGDAEFKRPQGMALLPDGTLYVADTENHAIRRIDMRSRRVQTVRAGLRSPWDVAHHDGVLYIAMAGSHQIWRLNPDDGRMEPFAGSGREARIDGPRMRSAFAQPSGLAIGGGKLFVADSEISAVRVVDLADGRGETVVGGDLFEFGDVDGVGDAARLQHPLGVAWHEGVLYVADTFNNKVRRLDPARREVAGFLGSGRSGSADGVGAEAEFAEPGGVSVLGGRLYVADTSNHVIREADLTTGRVETLHAGDRAAS